MADDIIVECECGRRYMRMEVAREDSGPESETCACDRTLGEWSGPVRYVFEPESDGD